MTDERSLITITVILIILVIAVGCYYGVNQLTEIIKLIQI